MAVNPGELLVNFIGIQATPATIGAAVQGAVQNGGEYSATDLGVASLNSISAVVSLGQALDALSVSTKAVGGLAGVAALAGLANDVADMKSQLDPNTTTTEGKITDSTLLSAMSNVSALVAAVAGTMAAGAGAVVGAPLIVAGLATAAAVGLGYAALIDQDTDIADMALDLLSKAKSLCDMLGDAMSDFAGDLADGFIDFGLGLGDFLNGIGQDINDLFNRAKNWFPRRDPLTLDLDGDGLETAGIDPNNPILFDHDGDGVKNATGWVKPDDGFLVLDRNGNGSIDDGSELFGDSTPLSNGGTAADGFAALQDQDTNHDGVVNAQDANWADLRVWRDANQNGISEANELTTLEANGIAGLIVTKTENAQPLANGNQIADLGHFIKTDGSEGALGQVTGGMADIDLADNPFYREFTDTLDTSSVASLPDMQGSGSVRDLQEAASLSPALANAVESYSQADTKAAQMAQVDALIEQWAATSGNQTSIELAEEQGYRLVYLIPGLSPLDFYGPNFILGTGGAPTPGLGESRNYQALMAQQEQITELIGLLEMFNGITFVNLEPEGVRTGANDEVWERAA